MTRRAGLLTVVLALLGAPARADAPAPDQAAFAPDLEVVDVPTAYTAYARMFNFNIRMFAGGGIVSKAVASFNNSLQLGVAFKADNVIGSGSIGLDDQPEQVVSAVVKLKVVNLAGPRIQLAAGYDGMGYGTTRKRGLYAVASRETGLAAVVFRLHAGAGAVRFRGFDARKDLSLFAGLTAALTEEIRLGLEYDDVLLDDGYGKGYVNAGIGYAWDMGLRLELDLKGLFRGDGPTGYTRVLKIVYSF